MKQTLEPKQAIDSRWSVFMRCCIFIAKFGMIRRDSSNCNP